jgi:hypothetical protein
MSEKQQTATSKKSTKQDIFIEEFAKHGNVSLACRTVAINRTTFYRWKEQSDTFLLRYNLAMEGSGSIEYASPLEIVPMEKKTKAKIMHRHRFRERECFTDKTAKTLS